MVTQLGAQEAALAFGPFQLFRAQKMLLENGRPVRLGSRALELLIALVERPGEVVSKNELFAYGWPNIVVEESALRVHIAAIRRILGDGQSGARYIVNLSGRGYSFIAPVSRVETAAPTVASESDRSNLPVPIARAVGRAEAVKAIAAQVPKRRLVTIIGPGGVGKTTVALAVAEQLAELYGHNVRFADLAAVDKPSLVPATLATVVGISALVEEPVQSLVNYLRHARMLIVMDNCEHVIASAAQVAERILRASADVVILATSREPLLIEGEYVHNLAALATPPSATDMTADRALHFTSVQLFVERTVSGLETFELTDQNANAVAGICRRLDGIPLAIELVAARVGLFGIDALASTGDETLILKPRGRRTASARHRSLRATLDWSYRLLNPLEQAILRRLAVFRGLFSAESAIAVASEAEVGAADVFDGLLSLVGKSLLTTDIGGSAIRYRLLHITRAHAAETLAESGELRRTLLAHANHFCVLLQGASGDWEKLTGPQWVARHGGLIDDVRAALDWAFSADGDTGIATTLTAASLPFGLQMCLIDEFKRRAEIALERLAHLPPPQPISELHILLALISVLHNTGAPADTVLSLIDRATTLSEQIGITRDRIDVLTARAVFPLELGDYVAALQATEALAAIAKRLDDPLANLIADRVAAQVYHHAGQHRRARTLAERVLEHPAGVIPFAVSRTTVDRRASMRVVLARILWLEGRAVQAQRVAAESVEVAASDGPSAICQALALGACPIAFWSGDCVTASRLTELLLEHSRRYTFTRWTRLGLCFRMTLALRSGDLKVAGPGYDDLAQAVPLGTLQRDLLGTLADHWIESTTIQRAERAEAGWCGPELLRAAAAMTLKVGGPNAAGLAESRLLQALKLAREQQALAWELRAMTSLAQLRQDQGRRREALEDLRAVYDRFREGHDTPDLMAARTLLESL